MKTCTSISGGQSSAYIAANYPSDYYVFALVCIEDKKCTPKDKKLVQMVSDRIGKEFIATAEDDIILHTILDLEQFIGKKIDWVAGETFDYVTEKKGGWLPNKLHRYCTVEMKLRPMHRWWREKIGEPVEMQIGFRAGEERRAKKMYEKLNEDGLLEFKDVVGKHSNGNNKWATIAWQSPSFPMIENRVFRDEVVEFWKDKPVRFAKRNNCVGCFHRNPLLLRTMFDEFPNKMEWFASKERIEGNGKWRSDIKYDKIAKHKLQHSLNFDDFEDCDSGHCGL
jgi:hypothetical protein